MCISAECRSESLGAASNRDARHWAKAHYGRTVRAYGRVTDQAALAGPGLLETLRRSCACAGRTQAGQRHTLPRGGASRSAGVVPTSYEPALRAAPHTGDMGSPRQYDEEAVQVSPSTSLRMPTCPHIHMRSCSVLHAPCLCSAPPRLLVRSPHAASLGSSSGACGWSAGTTGRRRNCLALLADRVGSSPVYQRCTRCTRCIQRPSK